MPDIEINTPRPLCPVGPGRFRLKEVEKKAMPDFNDKSVMVDRLIWKFIDMGDRRSEDGMRYEVAVFTGMKYGNDKAKLTWLLDMLHPGISADWIKKHGVNTDRYVGVDYEGSVKHVVSDGDTSRKTATFTYLRPEGHPAATPDPFEDGNAGSVTTCQWDEAPCATELSEKQIAACAKRWPNGLRLCPEHAKAQLALDRIAAAEAEDEFETVAA